MNIGPFSGQQRYPGCNQGRGHLPAAEVSHPRHQERHPLPGQDSQQAPHASHQGLPARAQNQAGHRSEC